MDTLSTPGTPISRGAMVQRASFLGITQLRTMPVDVLPEFAPP